MQKNQIRVIGLMPIMLDNHRKTSVWSFNPFPSEVTEILTYKQKLNHRDADIDKWVTALAWLFCE
jgi:hypothetical protein